jgi:hypothetical protein
MAMSLRPKFSSAVPRSSSIANSRIESRNRLVVLPSAWLPEHSSERGLVQSDMYRVTLILFIVGGASGGTWVTMTMLWPRLEKRLVTYSEQLTETSTQPPEWMPGWAKDLWGAAYAAAGGGLGAAVGLRIAGAFAAFLGGIVGAVAAIGIFLGWEAITNSIINSLENPAPSDMGVDVPPPPSDLGPPGLTPPQSPSPSEPDHGSSGDAHDAGAGDLSGRSNGFGDPGLGDPFGDEGSCFIPGTLVTTPRGLVPIQQIQVGDVVAAWNAVTGTQENRLVIRTSAAQGNFLTSLRFGRQIVSCTPLHRFFTGTWTPAKDLRAGDRVLRLSGRWSKVKSQSTAPHMTAVHNISVEGLRNYSVGRLGLIVHNDKESVSV